MRKIIYCFCCCFIATSAFSQPEINYNDPFNVFQKFYYDSVNVDSAFFYLEKIVADKRLIMLARTAVNDEIAQSFPLKEPSTNDTAEFNRYKKQHAIALQVLQKAVNDTSVTMQQLVRPLWLTVTVQQHLGDDVVNGQTVKQFIDTELNDSDIANNSKGRYAVRIYQLIQGDARLQPLRAKIFSIIKQRLLAGQIVVTGTSTRAELEKRSWYRWMYAYTNYIEAGETNNAQKKEILLKMAYDYSPDFYDKTYRADYFYDMIYLTGDEKDGFEDEYLNFLLAKGVDKNTLLHMLLNMTLNNPVYKARLKHFYDSVNTTANSFDSYWLNAIYKKSKDAPLINLVGYEGARVESKQYSGKWVLVDFWGTWCPVCRMEHPNLQKFYDTAILKSNGKIALLTIAAKDTKEKVEAYMKEKKFSFPVAMSDGAVEDKYRVQGYPTKLLITPQGKYIEIPFGVDWQEFVKDYCDL